MRTHIRRRCSLTCVVVIVSVFPRLISAASTVCDLAAEKPQPHVMSNNWDVRQEQINQLFDTKDGRYGKWREFTTHTDRLYRICHYTELVFRSRTGVSRNLDIDEINDDMASKWPVRLEYIVNDTNLEAIELLKLTVMDP